MKARAKFFKNAPEFKFLLHNYTLLGLIVFRLIFLNDRHHRIFSPSATQNLKQLHVYLTVAGNDDGIISL